MHLLIHLFLADAGEVKENTEMLEVQKFLPKAEGVDDVVNRSDCHDFLVVGIFDGGTEIKWNLGAI